MRKETRRNSRFNQSEYTVKVENDIVNMLE